jgi:succinate dehydrogenase flavin-adding protein (antitoxin of CptAB toxin-antitoxin module)
MSFLRGLSYSAIVSPRTTTSFAPTFSHLYAQYYSETLSAPKSTLTPIEKQRRRLLYQSRERGMHEVDLLLSTFADKYLPVFNQNQLDDYDRIIRSEEPELYKWISGNEIPPAELQGEVMNLILAHVQSNPLNYSKSTDPKFLKKKQSREQDSLGLLCFSLVVSNLL